MTPGDAQGPLGPEPAALGRRILHLREVDSTQDHLRRLAEAGAPHGTVVWADEQTRGRGRRGARWEARAGDALLVSVLVRSPALPAAGAALSLVWPLAALGVLARVLGRGATERLAVKWPNDLLLDGGKLMGVLVEGVEGGAVVGAGLNLALPPDAPEERAQLGVPVDREGLLHALLKAWDGASRIALERGFAPFRPLYRTVLAYRGEAVTLATESGSELGRLCDVDPQGRLVLETPGGRRAFWAGEVQRLRPGEEDPRAAPP